MLTPHMNTLIKKKEQRIRSLKILSSWSETDALCKGYSFSVHEVIIEGLWI